MPTLEQRLSSLERSNRRWKMLAMLMPLCLIGMGMSMVNNIVADRVRAKTYEVWDSRRGGLVLDVEQAILAIEAKLQAAQPVPPTTPPGVSASTKAELATTIRRFQDLQTAHTQPGVRVTPERRQRVYGALLSMIEAKTEADAQSALAKAKDVLYGE